MDFKIEHIISNITLPEFERLYFDEPFNEALCKAVDLQRLSVNIDNTNNTLKRAVQVKPNRSLPGFLDKLVGKDALSYTEHMTYTWGSYTGTWKTEPHFQGVSVKSEGEVRFETVPNGVKRIISGHVSVSIPLVGSKVEKEIIEDVKKSYTDAAQFTNQWIQQGKHAAAAGA